jgi:hypothetical protein
MKGVGARIYHPASRTQPSRCGEAAVSRGGAGRTETTSRGSRGRESSGCRRWDGRVAGAAAGGAEMTWGGFGGALCWLVVNCSCSCSTRTRTRIATCHTGGSSVALPRCFYIAYAPHVSTAHGICRYVGGIGNWSDLRFESPQQPPTPTPTPKPHDCRYTAAATAPPAPSGPQHGEPPARPRRGGHTNHHHWQPPGGPA